MVKQISNWIKVSQIWVKTTIRPSSCFVEPNPVSFVVKADLNWTQRTISSTPAVLRSSVAPNVSTDTRPFPSFPLEGNIHCNKALRTSQNSIITVSLTGSGGSSNNKTNLILTFQCGFSQFVRWSYQKISCANRYFPGLLFNTCQRSGIDIFIYLYIYTHTHRR